MGNHAVQFDVDSISGSVSFLKNRNEDNYWLIFLNVTGKFIDIKENLSFGH